MADELLQPTQVPDFPEQAMAGQNPQNKQQKQFKPINNNQLPGSAERNGQQSSRNHSEVVATGSNQT